MKFADAPLTTVRVYTMKEAGFNSSVFFEKLDKFGGVDEVWLSTLEGNNSIEDHKKFIDELRPIAEGLRRRNIIVSIQLSSCIGHFGAPLVENGFPWTADDLMVDVSGITVDGICCPSSEAFTAWSGDILAMYCKALDIHAAYIDDDVRFWNHGAISEGCFCRKCLAKFSAITGKNWSREELAAALEDKKVNPVRTQWLDFHTASMAEFCGKIAAKVHAASPETVMGIQTVHSVLFHDCWNFTPVYKAMAEATGKPARVRIGGGTWTDFTPYCLVEKAFYDSSDSDDAKASGYVDLITCEIENCPCTVTNKSAYTFGLQGALSLAFATTSTSFQSGSLWFSGSEVMDDFFGNIAKWRNIYEILSHGAKNYTKDGLNLAFVTEYINEPKFDVEYDNHWWRITYKGADSFLYNGFPVFMSKERVRRGQGASMVTGYSALGIDSCSLKSLLKNGLLLSGNAFKELAGRGLMDFTGVKVVENGVSFLLMHTNDPLNGKVAGVASTFTGMEAPCVGFDVSGTDARVLATYTKAPAGKDAAAWVMEGEWGRLAVVGYPGEFSRFIHGPELELFRNIFDWVNGSPLAVRQCGFETLTLVPEIDENNACRLVSVLNNGIAPRQNVALEVRNPAGKKFFWNLPGAAPVQLNAVRTGNDVKVVIPSLAAWEFGVITVE